ncbi:MAG: hypothetical protein KDD10_28270 [Phaeodactylibacter sp.]|nr:hypothetical protein [Phaeodactylibacter sp.]MCB9291534.1 hypothetical protein [Lewinellaceae bacterium]
MRNATFLALSGHLILFTCTFAFSAAAAGAATVAPPSCPCGSGYRQIELNYAGPDHALVEVFSDEDFGNPDNLSLTFAAVANGDLLELNAADAPNLPEGIFARTTHIRVTAGEEVTTTSFFSTCPDGGVPEPLPGQIILGRTFGYFTVMSHTDNRGHRCTVADLDSGSGWSLFGNVVDAGANQLGTQNEEDVVLITNGEPHGIITREGRFGFGTTATTTTTVTVLGGITVAGNSIINGSDNDGVEAALSILSGDQVMLIDGNEIDAANNALYLNNNSERDIILARGGGNVSIGNITPNARLHVDGDLRLQSPNNETFRMSVDNNGDLNFIGDHGVGVLQVDDASGNTRVRDADGNNVIVFQPRDNAAQVGGRILLRAGSPLESTINIDGNWNGTGRGRIRVDEVQIMGGADISENFEVIESTAEAKAVPGMLVSISAGSPGQLEISSQAYDKKAVGVISGANGVNTGLFMGQKGSAADGQYPVALMGRVYVLADAAFGKIEAGDLLTSSPVAGHAMKVKKAKKAQGAIVGKAMTSLEEGRGYVLVLVNLQ